MANAIASDGMEPLLPYERNQLGAIIKWKKEEPGVIAKVFGIVVTPLSWLVQKIVPQAVIRSALTAANQAGRWLADKDDVMREGGVASIQDLQHKSLSVSDTMADSVQNWAIGIAVVEGTATGAGGIFTAPVDIPAIILIATRTIHKIGLCYGYECKSKEDMQYVLGILAASGANAMEEKLAALATLKAIQVAVAGQTWKLLAEKAAQSQVSKEAAIIAIRNLAKQLGINLTKRRVLAAIPAIGAVIGGSVNGWYIRDVGWAARRAFQERWLLDNHKVLPE
jgi:hypothetical protein